MDERALGCRRGTDVAGFGEKLRQNEVHAVLQCRRKTCTL